MLGLKLIHVSKRGPRPQGVTKLEQLECMHSENTPRRHMISHTIDSYQIPSENKTKSKLQICQKFEFWNFAKRLYTWHTFWSCLIRCENIKCIQLVHVLWKLQSGQDSVHRRTDRKTDDVKPVYPPFHLVEAGGIIIAWLGSQSPLKD